MSQLKYKYVALSYNFLPQKTGNFQTNRNYKQDAHAKGVGVAYLFVGYTSTSAAGLQMSHA